MRIALDYDGTYTRDVNLWNEFISNALRAGHTVTCVTMRYPHEEITMPCQVIYTSRQAKARFTIMHGHEFDIWIDDNPHYIFQNAA